MNRDRVNRKERRKTEKKNLLKVTLTWAFQIIVVVMFAYVLVFFFGQMRTNVGQSMATTLEGGDTVLLNELSYKIGGPSRNDIIAFKLNGSDSSHAYIKRVIGLPGETIQIKDGIIYINDVAYLENHDFPDMEDAGLAAEPIVLGATEYFVLGDNRNSSEDSRYADIGTVNFDDIEGKVWLIVSPWAHFGRLK